MIDEKLTIIKENNQKVFNAGKFKTLNKSKYMHPTVSGSAISVNDVSVVEHSLGVSVKRKNLLPFPYQQGTITQNGGTATVNSDGTITFSGIPTAYMGIVLYNGKSLVTNGIYTISIGKETNNVSATIFLYDIDGNTVLQQGFTSGITINFDEYPTVTKWNITLSRSASNKEMSGTAYPQLELGTTATEYTPYVADLSGVEVSRYGKNLLSYPYGDTTKTVNGITFTDNGDGTVTATGTATANADFNLNGWFKIKKGMIVSSGTTGDAADTYEVFVNGMDGTMLRSRDNQQYADHDFTANMIRIRVRPGTVVNGLVFKPQLELGKTATTYELYKEPQTAIANADGIVEGLTSLSPNMTLISDTEGVVINCGYYRDIDTYIDNLTTNIALTGGN